MVVVTVLVMLFVVMMMLVLFMFIVVIVNFAFFKLLAPARACIDGFKFKASRCENITHRNIAVACFDNLYARVQHFDDLADFLELVFRDQILFVDNERWAELNLLNQERLNIFLTDCLFCKQFVSAREFVNQAGSVNHADHIVEFAVFNKLQLLSDWHWLAHARSLNHDVVVFARFDEVFDILGKLAFERTADTTVCERNDVARIGDFRSVSNQFCIYIYFADVIYDNGDLVAFLIVKHFIEQCGFSRTEITAEQCHWGKIFSHF